MSRYISASEFWDQVRNLISLPEKVKAKEQLKLSENFGKINLNHYTTGMGIRYFSFESQFVEDTILENSDSQDSAFFCFNTGDSIYMEDSCRKKQVKWDSDVCWCGKQHDGHKAHSLYSKHKKNMLHYIILDKKLYNDITSCNENFSRAKTVYKGDYIDVKLNNYITHKQKVLLNDLLNSSHLDNKLQEIYIESKLLDLLYTTVNSVENQKTSDGIYLSSKDIESLNKAKKLLTDDIVNPPSLKQLAYKSAINEFKLKKGFKQVFGNTVYGFLQEYRLNEAKELLENNEINIGEASTLVGYKSISHFSKIFKEQFGINPINIKKEQKKIYI